MFSQMASTNGESRLTLTSSRVVGWSCGGYGGTNMCYSPKYMPVGPAVCIAAEDMEESTASVCSCPACAMPAAVVSVGPATLPSAPAPPSAFASSACPALGGEEGGLGMGAALVSCIGAPACSASPLGSLMRSAKALSRACPNDSPAAGQAGNCAVIVSTHQTACPICRQHRLVAGLLQCRQAEHCQLEELITCCRSMEQHSRDGLSRVNRGSEVCREAHDQHVCWVILSANSAAIWGQSLTGGVRGSWRLCYLIQLV